MVDLTLSGLSEDNARLLLVNDSGQEFTLAIDQRLRAALRGEHARLGQLEIQMESALRPRDIQNRIRAGETPEQVAQAAQTGVDKIMPFANPVLAEREHVALRAQSSSVRRKAGDPGARTLGDAVAAHLRPLNVDPEVVEWDSFRREDGRWILTATYDVEGRKGNAHFAHDKPGNYVTLEDDDARWLVGEQIAKPAPAEGRKPRQRRLSAVPGEDELPLGDDAIELVTDESELEESAEPENEASGFEDSAADDEQTADLTDTASKVRRTRRRSRPAPDEQPDSAPEDAEDLEQTDGQTDREPASETDEPEETDKPAPRRNVRKKGGRASVPSWDEIMFGGGKPE